MSPIWTPADRSPEESGAADLLGHLDLRAAEQLTGSPRCSSEWSEHPRGIKNRRLHSIDLRRYRGELGTDWPPMSPGVKRLEKVALRRSRTNDASTTTSLLIVRSATGLPNGRRIGDIRHVPRDIDAPHTPRTKCRHCTCSC